MRRSLRLRREQLTPLTPDEQTAVAGGSHFCIASLETCTSWECPTGMCPTFPINPCLSRICVQTVS